MRPFAKVVLKLEKSNFRKDEIIFKDTKTVKKSLIRLTLNMLCCLMRISRRRLNVNL